MTLSAIVITRNEAENIAECLESLSFADERIVVDSGSTDETVAIAKEYTSKVFITEWKGYGAAKQWALEQAMGDWVLWLDADERIPASLADEILTALDGESALSGFQMPRKAFFLGRWIRHSGWYPGYVIRLFRKTKVQFGEERVHESLRVNGSVGTLKEPILHYTDRTIHHYFRKFNRYTSLAAEDLWDHGRTVTRAGIFFRPIFMFFKMYIVKAGFLDGIQGFLLAVFSASYVFIKYTKLWEFQTAKIRIPGGKNHVTK